MRKLLSFKIKESIVWFYIKIENNFKVHILCHITKGSKANLRTMKTWMLKKL